MPWKVFAEDAGTGLQDQSDHDFGDGANFGAHVHSPNDTDYAPVAPTLSADYTVPEVTLGEAQYKIKATNVSGRVRDGTQTTWPEVTFVVKAPQTAVSLTDGTVNHIYVDVDLTTTGDDAQYVVNTAGSAPADPSLKVAEVDTSANTTDVFSANPNVVGQTVASQYVINDDVSVPDGHGAVAVGPLEGDGSITGDGRLAVIQEGTQFTDNVDAQGNDINNVGAVGANSLNTGSINNTVHLIGADATGAEINDLLANEARNGDTILCENGDSPIILTEPIRSNGRDDITWIGGWFKVADSTSINAFGFDDTSRVTKDWTIKQVEIDGNADNQTDEGDTNSQNGIWGFDVTGFTVEDNYVHDTVYSNIRFIGGQDCQIEDNNCIRTTGSSVADGISFTSRDGSESTGSDLDGIASQQSRNGVVRDNLIRDCDHQSIEIAKESFNFRVENNDIYNGEEIGIFHHADGVAYIEGNYLENTGRNGQGSISLDARTRSGKRSIVRANEIVNPVDLGMRLNQTFDCMVENNIIRDVSSSAALRVEVVGTSSQNFVENCVIRGNIIDNCDFAFDLRDLQDSKVLENVFLNTTNAVVEVKDGCSDVTVGDNIIKGSGGAAVVVSSGATDTNIRDNEFENNSTDINDSGTRTRWNGVIGGGRLGGVDLSSVSGQYEGDRAVASGASTADEGDEASWDSSVPEWRVFQPATTV